MLNCDQAPEWISARLDGALTDEENDALRAHLERCPACRALASDLEVLHTALETMAEHPAAPPADLSAKILARVGGSTAVPPPGAGRRHWRSWMAMAAVFTLLILGVGTQKPWDPALNSSAWTDPGPAVSGVPAQAAGAPAPLGVCPQVSSDIAAPARTSTPGDAEPNTAVAASPPSAYRCQPESSASPDTPAQPQPAAAEEPLDMAVPFAHDEKTAPEFCCGILTVPAQAAGPLEGLEFTRSDGIRRYLVTAGVFAQLASELSHIPGVVCTQSGDGISADAPQGLILVADSSAAAN